MANEQVMSGLVEPQGLGEEPLYYFTRCYLLFLQGLFKQFPEGSFRWSDDEKLSEISITDQVPIPREVVEARPAIVTMRGPAQAANLTLDQMRRVDSHTGKKERTDLVACTMSLNAIARNGVEAQRIGWIIFSNLRTFKTVLQRNAHFFKLGDDIQIGPESPPGTLVKGEVEPEMVMVTVYSPFFFQWTVQDTPSAPLLRGIEAHLQSALLPAGSGGLRSTLNPPTIRGRVLAQETGNLRIGEIAQTVKT